MKLKQLIAKGISDLKIISEAISNRKVTDKTLDAYMDIFLCVFTPGILIAMIIFMFIIPGDNAVLAAIVLSLFWLSLFVIVGGWLSSKVKHTIKDDNERIKKEGMSWTDFFK